VIDIIERALYLYQHTKTTVEEIVKETKIDKATLYRHIANRNIPKRGIVGTRARKHSFNMNKFIEDSREKFYWLGFISADGAVVKNSMRIELKDIDEQHLIKFNKFFENTTPLSYRVNNLGCHSVWTTINSCELNEYLSQYGIVPNKSSTINMDNIPDEYKYDFIRGYMDGDGSIGIRNRQIYLQITTGSWKLINQIEEIFQTGNKITDYTTYYTLATLGNKKALSILHKIYENSTEDTRLDRKYEIYAKFDPRLSD
jgi:intein/homing endonuclease